MSKTNDRDLRMELQTTREGAPHCCVCGAPARVMLAGADLLVCQDQACKDRAGSIYVEHATPRNDLLELARSFPTLRNVPTEFFEEGPGPLAGSRVGFTSTGAQDFARWVASEGGGGMRDAGLFVLSVWNASTNWGKWLRRAEGPMGGRFDPHRALGNWDRGHRAAFLAWASDPWWL